MSKSNLSRNWQNILIDDNNYMICAVLEDNVWTVSLTNMIDIWIEVLTQDVIRDRCKRLNPLLDIQALDYSDIVSNVLKNIPQNNIGGTVNCLKLRMTIEDGILKFELNFNTGTPQQFWDHVTQPLCLVSMELLRQNKILVDSIKQKDIEITEYKAGGAELLRKNIETKAYSEEMVKPDVNELKTFNCTKSLREIINYYNEVGLNRLLIKQETPEVLLNTESCDTKASTAPNPNSPDSKVEIKSQNKVISNPLNRIIMENNEKMCRPPKKAKKGLNDFIS